VYAACWRGQREVIGLVIVSHSAKLAQGVYELAAQMAGDQVGISLAGGLCDDCETLGPTRRGF